MQHPICTLSTLRFIFEELTLFVANNISLLKTQFNALNTIVNSKCVKVPLKLVILGLKIGFIKRCKNRESLNDRFAILSIWYSWHDNDLSTPFFHLERTKRILDIHSKIFLSKYFFFKPQKIYWNWKAIFFLLLKVNFST